MPTPNYWFERDEYTTRLARVQAEIQRRGLDALIAFQPESVTWVTGFYSRAYSSFQFAIIPASGAGGDILAVAPDGVVGIDAGRL
ncbi:MAG: aminopeptidase P family N-terminal domain-containing protein [Roseiflexaceae bacterium]